MITKWARNLILQVQENLFNINSSAFRESLPTKDKDGNLISNVTELSLPTGYSIGTFVNTNAAYLTVMFGKGTGVLSDENFNLFDLISSGLSYSNVSDDQILENDVVYRRKVISITNTSNENITITEVGLFYKQKPNSDSRHILIDHQLFDTPLVLTPSQSATVVYETYLPIN